MVIKISKIQKRLATKAANRLPVKSVVKTPVVTQNYSHPPTNYEDNRSTSSQEPAEPHVVFMSASNAGRYNLKGAAVLSLVNANLNTKEAVDYAQTRFDVCEITPRAIETIHNFVKSNLECNKFVIHCTYGEQRSRAVAHFIKRVIDSSRSNRNFGIYRFESDRYTSDLDRLSRGDMISYRALMRDWREMDSEVAA